jgi:hypothetical protein
MAPLQTYVVRVYRRTAKGRLSGTIETVVDGRIAPFRSFKQLRTILQVQARSS